MKKFIINKKDDFNEHWNYCHKNDIPFVQIFHSTKFSKIEFDAISMFRFHNPTESSADPVIGIYKSYCTFFHLPKNKISSTGGSNNLIFTVFKEHAEFIAIQLFDFIDNYVKNNRKELLKDN